jgi:hypothetical protein
MPTLASCLFCILRLYNLGKRGKIFYLDVKGLAPFDDVHVVFSPNHQQGKGKVFRNGSL